MSAVSWRRASGRVARVAIAACMLASGCASFHTGAGTTCAVARAPACPARGANAYGDLEELATRIGPRLTGSPNERRAIAWALGKMRAYGLEGVHEEPWILGHGWQRGDAHAEMVAPSRAPLRVAAYGWTGSTPPGGMAADLVAYDTSAGMKDLGNLAAHWTGRIVFVTRSGAARRDPLTEFATLGSLVRAAERAGAVAMIRRDPRPGPLVHAEPVDFRARPYGIPVLDIDAGQQEMLEALLRHGERVTVRVDVENRVSDGPVASSNAVGEIRGWEHPEQYVVVGAHIDSWDLATGSVDDGFGVAAVLGAARALAAIGHAPRRTIRFVLFTGEEQGLLGSRAYVSAHRAEIGDAVCAFALDWGQGPIAAIPLAGHPEMRGAFERAATALRGVGRIPVRDGYLTYTDAYAFTLAGVPGIGLYQESPGYGAIGHSPADTLDKVDPRILDRNVSVLASLALGIADDPGLPRQAWGAAKTARALTRDHQDTALRWLGMWPFPSDGNVSETIRRH